MTSVLGKNIARYLIFLMLQVLLLNNILISGYINPYLYLIFVLLLPFNTPRLLLLLLGFVMGISVDILSHTMGVHAAATVAMAYFRPRVIKYVYSRKDFEPGIEPVLADMGFNWVLSYSMILIIIHHIVLFYLEAFTFNGFWITLWRAIVSSAFSLLLVIITHYLIYKDKK